ncbi:imelysin family protein [Paracoccus albus]|uniref:imelysin family protein n=1 Tax=Paracoccus albus TaxID=3017784 RepID=UPI0022EFDC45|nr:imelysin family protein [Paracoccus albus]WBU61061.1 imelysin family protein [Paracoccus albus]
MRHIQLVASAIALAGTIAHADVGEVARDVIGPAYRDFAAATAAANDAAMRDCSAAPLRDHYQDTWDEWAKIDFFRLGPVEEGGRAFAISFWPDKKSSGQRAQQSLIDSNSGVIDDPEAFATVSVAARGLSGLERLLYESDLEGDEDVLCRLRRATAADLARTAQEIADEWPSFQELLTSAGAEGNSRYLSPAEAQQAVYTQIITGLDHLVTNRLGRPIGTAEKPRPDAAEAGPSGRSLRNIELSLTGLRDAAMALHPEAAAVQQKFDEAIAIAQEMNDPTLAGVADPEGRKRALALARAVLTAKLAVETDIGMTLGIGVGFNSTDGD